MKLIRKLLHKSYTKLEIGIALLIYYNSSRPFIVNDKSQFKLAVSII